MHSLNSRILLLLSCILLSSFTYAGAGPIIVKANESTTVSLFFPSPIAKVIEPASHFHFTHEAAGSLATLKASKGKPSNLTVITRDGAVFSFALNYSDSIDNFTFVIVPEQAIGKRGAIQSGTDNAPSDIAPTPPTKSIAEDSPKKRLPPARRSNKNSSNLVAESAKTEVEVGEADLAEYSDDNFVEKGSFYDMDREGYYEIFCENSYLQRTITKNNIRDNRGVDLRLNHIAIDQNEMYFTLQFRNVSKSDYNVESVRFYIQSKGGEELLMTPLYTYNQENFIKQSAVNKFVYVFKDFQLGSNQKVFVVMNEKDGIRNIVLPLNLKDLLEDLE